jgi:MFS-type transporter involved in bile tolerance (Atg22 family)
MLSGKWEPHKRRARSEIMAVALLVWLILSIIVGVAAERRGRSGLAWIFLSVLLSVLLSPLISAIVLALLPDSRYQKAMQRLAAYDRAAAQGHLRGSR